MVCEKCHAKMNWSIEKATQGWRCPACGWNMVTTYIDDISLDMTEYSICVKSVEDIDKDKIKVIAQIAGVNYIVAKQMLEREDTCILRAKAVDIMEAIYKLRNVNIPFKVIPEFDYQ